MINCFKVFVVNMVNYFYFFIFWFNQNSVLKLIIYIQYQEVVLGLVVDKGRVKKKRRDKNKNKNKKCISLENIRVVNEFVLNSLVIEKVFECELNCIFVNQFFQEYIDVKSIGVICDRNGLREGVFGNDVVKCENFGEEELNGKVGMCVILLVLIFIDFVGILSCDNVNF